MMSLKQPNFIFIITDQHRADYLGCAGHPVLKTPHIDAIAARGMRFDRFYVANPVCMPNRATLMTGRMTSINGVRHNGLPLAVESNTFVDVLRAGGYRTALIGKSHLQTFTDTPPNFGANPSGSGPLSEARRISADGYGVEEPPYWKASDGADFPSPYYGFDHVDFVTEHGDHTGGKHLAFLREKLGDVAQWSGEGSQLPHNYSCPQAIRTRLPEELYSTFYIRDRAIEWLDSNAGGDAPYFCFVSFPDPHHPFTPPGRYWDMYNPDDMALPESFDAHKNPPPTLQWLRAEFDKGGKPAMAQNAFMADARAIREAMALTCGMITMIDDAVGAILAAAKARGDDRDTIIVFNADHGDFMGDHGMLLKGPMHFQSLIRVPFIWSDPAQPRVGNTDQLSGTVDIARTILARAGLTPYNGMQGVDLAPALKGEPLAREGMLIEDDQNKVFLGFKTAPRARTLVTAQHRLTLYLDAPWGELYDLVADPHECENLWDQPQHRPARDNLVLQLAHEMMRTVDRSPWPRRIA